MINQFDQAIENANKEASDVRSDIALEEVVADCAAIESEKKCDREDAQAEHNVAEAHVL